MHTHMILKNPQASEDMMLELVVTTNTDEKKILENVLYNSKRVNEWIKQEEPNDKTLLICGSGPSIKYDIGVINEMHGSGCEIWALNNCANWLYRNKILPDAQVIMDAQPCTKTVLGHAKRHLFASQCDPELFDLVSDAELWHATYGEFLVDEQEGFPQHDDYCLIGASISVGNTAIVLAYAMGYRNIHLFGYDSSHSGDYGHVLHQKINDTDPLTLVKFGNKTYLSSLTMKLQAENFIQRAEAVKAGGCQITMHGEGLLPDMYKVLSGEMDEKSKYEQMWNIPLYRKYSPGEQEVESFLDLVKPSGLVIDYGCGTGRAAVKIKEYGCDVLLLDFTENSRDEIAKSLPFAQQDLTCKIEHKADYGYCTDVMEHLPTPDVSQTIDNIMDSCSRVFFQISTVPDTMGAIIGKQLHLTVKPHSWWRRLFMEKGLKIEWEICFPSESQFYITKGK